MNVSKYLFILVVFTFYSLQCSFLVKSWDPVSKNTQNLAIGGTIQKKNTASFPLYGSIDSPAYWFADIYVGYPKHQRQSLIIDTGSSVTGFPCKDCGDNCGHHIDAPYDLSLSETDNSITCSTGCSFCTDRKNKLMNPFMDTPPTDSNSGTCAYIVNYTEGSQLAGKFFKDIIVLQQRNTSNSEYLEQLNPMNEQMVYCNFGCHNKETFLFFDQLASGIAGMQVVDDFGVEPLVVTILDHLKPRDGSRKVDDNDQDINHFDERDRYLRFLAPYGHDYNSSSKKFKQNKTQQYQNAFSICFSPSGGILTFGGYHEELHLHTINVKNENVTKTAPSTLYSTKRYLESTQEVGKRATEDGNTTSESPKNFLTNDSQVFLMLGIPPTGSVRLNISDSSDLYLNVEPGSFPMNRSKEIRDGEVEKKEKFAPPDMATIEVSLQQVIDETLNYTVLDLGTYLQNSFIARHLQCFKKKKPVSLYYHPSPEDGTSRDARMPFEKYFIVLSPETQGNIIRCLKGRFQKDSVNRRKHTTLRNSYFVEYTTPVIMQKRPHIRDKITKVWDVWTDPSETISVKKKSVMTTTTTTMTKGIEKGYSFVEYSNCKLDENNMLSGDCAELEFVKNPWCVWNVSKKDVITMQELLLGLQKDSSGEVWKEDTSSSSSVIDFKTLYIPPESTVQWTPFLSFHYENFLDDDAVKQSYLVTLTNWAVKGISSYPKYIVSLPLMDYPTEDGMYPNPFPTRALGLIPMIDSGSTLSSLPLLVYASLWIGIVGHMTKAKQILGDGSNNNIRHGEQLNSRSRLLSETSSKPAPLRVQGLSLDVLENRVKKYVQKMERRYEFLSFMNQNGQNISSMRQLFEDKKFMSFGRSSDKGQTTTFPHASKVYRVLSRLDNAKSLLRQLKDLRTNIEEQLLDNKGTDISHIDSETGRMHQAHAPRRWLENSERKLNESEALQKDNSTEWIRSNRTRSLFEERRLSRLIETTDLGSLIKPYKHFSTSQKIKSSQNMAKNHRMLYPQAIENLEQECWYLTQGSTDLEYFGDMELTFLQNARYIWRPHSFLYKRREGNIYCLTIVLKNNSDSEDGMEDNVVDASDLYLDDELDNFYPKMRSGLTSFGQNNTFFFPPETNPRSNKIRSKKRDRGLVGEDLEEESAIFGTSFFINHDIIFHIERWSLGMIEAQCPLTNLTERLKRPAWS